MPSADRLEKLKESDVDKQCVADVHLWWRVIAGAIMTAAATGFLVHAIRFGLHW